MDGIRMNGLHLPETDTSPSEPVNMTELRDGFRAFAGHPIVNTRLHMQNVTREYPVIEPNDNEYDEEEVFSLFLPDGSQKKSISDFAACSLQYFCRYFSCFCSTHFQGMVDFF